MASMEIDFNVADGRIRGQANWNYTNMLTVYIQPNFRTNAALMLL